VTTALRTQQEPRSAPDTVRAGSLLGLALGCIAANVIFFIWPYYAAQQEQFPLSHGP